METKKKIVYCAALAVLTVGLSFAVYHLGRICNINSRANVLMNNSMSELNTEYNNVNSKKEMLEKQKKELTSQIKEKSGINKDIEKSMKEINSMTEEISSAKKKSDELDAQISEKNKELTAAEKIASSASGKRFNAGAGTYTCPANIAPGRYTVSGDYTLIIYSANGSPKVSENLSHLETKSFVFTISEGERIKLVK